MIAYQKEKIDNAICFFAAMHKKKTRHYLHQTFLYKYLAFLEYNMLEKNGHLSLGLKFNAFRQGPVPVDLHDNRTYLENDLFKFQDIGNQKFQIIAKKKPDLDYFSKEEIDEMNTLIDIYAKSYIPSNLISEASHEKIKAWKKTYKKSPNSVMDSSLTFDDNLYEKNEAELTYAEENYILYNALANNLNENRDSHKME